MALSIYQGFTDHPGALEHYGVLLMKQDQLPEAIRALEASVKLSPTPANHVALAQAYARKKDSANAEIHAAEALKADPSDFDLRMFYGQLLRDQRKFPQAEQQFQTAAQTKPESAPAWTELAGVLVMTEQFPAALAALERVRSLKAEAAGHFFLRGLVQDRMKIPKEALASYQRFLELSQGKNPDQEFQARQRVRTLQKEIKR